MTCPCFFIGICAGVYEKVTSFQIESVILLGYTFLRVKLDSIKRLEQIKWRSIIQYKKLNEICSIIDLYVDMEEAEEISAFFCNTINSYDAGGIRFSFEREGKNVRVILRGHEDAVMDILNAYYHR